MRVYACLHVVVGAGAAGPAVEVPLPRRRDEEVVLARVELQPSRRRTKRPATKVSLDNNTFKHFPLNSAKMTLCYDIRPG